jgi:hypothetical protein
MLMGLAWVLCILPLVQYLDLDSTQKSSRYMECWVMGDGFFTQPKKQRVELGLIGKYEFSSSRIVKEVELSYMGGFLQVDEQMSKSLDQFKIQWNLRRNHNRIAIHTRGLFSGPFIPVEDPDVGKKNRFMEPARLEFGSGLRAVLAKGVSLEALFPSILMHRKPKQSHLPDPSVETLLVNGHISALYWNQGAIFKLECVHQLGKYFGVEGRMGLMLLNRFERIGEWSMELKCKWLISQHVQCVLVATIKREGPQPATVNQDYSIRTTYIWNKP